MLRQFVTIILMTVIWLGSVMVQSQSQPRTIAILADHDSRYKIDGKTSPTLRLKSGEEVKLVITAMKAKTQNRDGSVHGFALLRKDGSKVPDWDLLLKPGTQEFTLRAPLEPGEYHVVCTVICSSGHEEMQMKVIVQD
jgi:hypothetical protein